MPNIQDAIKQANEAAASLTGGSETGSEMIEGSVDAAGMVTTFQKPSMATVAAATGLITRTTPYVKVNEFGIMIGKDKKTLLDGFKGQILMVEDKGFQVKHTIRFGNPATYLSTYDGAGCDKGGSWGDAMVKAKMADPKAEPYPAADIIVELSEEIKLKEQTLAAGSFVGINTSKSNFSEWQDFYQEVAAAGLLGEKVSVDLGHKEINYNGNTWGVITFRLAA